MAHNNLGLALFAAGQLQEAMKQYREAIRLQPNMAIAHNNLGKALEANGELQEALSEYSQAIGIEWIFTGARMNVLAARGKLEPSSRDSLRELVRVQEESPLALHFVGQAHPYAGTFDLNQGLTIAESCEVLLVKYIQTLVLLRDDPQEGMVGTTSGCD